MENRLKSAGNQSEINRKLMKINEIDENALVEALRSRGGVLTAAGEPATMTAPRATAAANSSASTPPSPFVSIEANAGLLLQHFLRASR